MPPEIYGFIRYSTSISGSSDSTGTMLSGLGYAAMPWDAVQICQASCPRATRCFRRVAVAHLPRQGSTTCLWWWTSPENLSLVHFTWFVVTCAVISYDFMWFHELHRHLSTKSKAHQAAMGPQHLNGQTHSENSHGWTSRTNRLVKWIWDLLS